MSDKQKTIRQEITLSGAGLHTGNPVTIRLARVRKRRNHLYPGRSARISRHQSRNREYLKRDDVAPRCTTIGRNEVVIHTVEHLMSTLCGLGVDNLVVEINANELPGLDGSGLNTSRPLKMPGLSRSRRSGITLRSKNRLP